MALHVPLLAVNLLSNVDTSDCATSTSLICDINVSDMRHSGPRIAAETAADSALRVLVPGLAPGSGTAVQMPVWRTFAAETLPAPAPDIAAGCPAWYGTAVATAVATVAAFDRHDIPAGAVQIAACAQAAVAQGRTLAASLCQSSLFETPSRSPPPCRLLCRTACMFPHASHVSVPI